jgi:aldehyde dehydrogenase (NAD+)
MSQSQAHRSGHGREKGFAALHDISQLRTTIIKRG